MRTGKLIRTTTRLGGPITRDSANKIAFNLVNEYAIEHDLVTLTWTEWENIRASVVNIQFASDAGMVTNSGAPMLSSPAQPVSSAYDIYEDSVGILLDSAANESVAHVRLAGLLTRAAPNLSSLEYGRLESAVIVADSSTSYWTISLETWEDTCLNITGGCSGHEMPQGVVAVPWVLIARVAALDALGAGSCALLADKGARLEAAAVCGAAASIGRLIG